VKKFLNDPQNMVDELLEGFCLANPELVRLAAPRIVANASLEYAGRVTVVGMGGSGHEPAPIGFVGLGMLDASVAGDIFLAPDAETAARAIKLADRGKGVVLVVLNHAGDLLTGRKAVELCRAQGIRVEMIVTQEDISSAPRSMASERRGLVGCVPLYKILGAAAAQGKSLEEVAAIGRRFADQMASLAVGVRGATNPMTGKLLAEFGDDDMEIGMGQHGEEGGGRQKLLSADETADIMLDSLLRDLQLRRGDEILLILDGMGSTTLMELFLVFRRCSALLRERGITLAANCVGNLLTVQEAAGFQMFAARMDEELLGLWNAPCDTPYFKKL